MTSNTAPDAPEVPLWYRLLSEAVAAAGKGGVTKVAARLGVDRSYVSQVIHGLRKSVPKTFTDRVIERFHVIPECPATLQPQPRSECIRLGCGAAPTHNPLSMRIWRMCQTCPNKPDEKEVRNAA